MKKALKVIGTIFYGLTVIAVVIVSFALLSTMVPIPGNIEVKIVKSGSMEPAIPTGALVVIRPVKEYSVGDVITFGRDTKREIPTTHRVVEKSESGQLAIFRTKGDANQDADPNPVLASEVIGKVLFSVPNAGFVIDFARTRAGFLSMVAIPAGLVILDELMTIFGEVRRMRKPAPVARHSSLPEPEPQVPPKAPHPRPERTGPAIDGIRVVRASLNEPYRQLPPLLENRYQVILR